MTLPDIAIRQLRPDDEPRLLALLQDTFDAWPGHDVPDALEHLRWKIHSNERAPGLHVVAEAEGRLVGSMVAMPRRVKVQEGELIANQPADIAVHPAYQNQGLVQRVYTFAYPLWREVCHFSYGRPGHPAFRRLQGRWTAESASHPFGNRPGILDCSLPAPAGPPATLRCSVRAVDAFDERFAAFWDEASRPFAFAVVRSPEYLNWRYADPRSGPSIIVLAEERERVLGYAVVRFVRGEAYLADLLALPRRADVVRALVAEAVRRAHEGASEAQCRLPVRHPYRRILREHGFVARRPRSGMMYTAYGPERMELEFLQDPRTPVHLTFGDTDWV